jgi:hypothetical protein
MFGTLMVQMAPLRIELQYEDCEDLVRFALDESAAAAPSLRDLLQINFAPEIIRRRRLRCMLKALHGFTYTGRIW